MPLYELSLLVKPLKKEEIVSCLKKVASIIWQQNGAITKIEYLGLNDLSHKLKSDGQTFFKANRFIYHVSIGQTKISLVKPEFKLEPDLLRANFVQEGYISLKPNYQCTLTEELLPPALRKSVQPLLKEARFRADRSKLH